MQEELTYEQAIQRLEVLASQLERGDVPIDQMARQLREAQQLVKHCRELLYRADEAVNTLLSASTDAQ